MKPRIVASVVNEHHCPIFRPGQRMCFSWPAVDGEASDAICGIAVGDLFGAISKATQAAEEGRDVGAWAAIVCGGCRTEAGKRARAYFSLGVEEEEAAIDKEELEVHARCLRKSRVFGALPDESFWEVVPYFTVEHFEEGEVLLRAGERGRRLYVVEEGEVEILRVSSGGDLERIVTLGEGECLGEMSLLTGDRTSATVRAITEVKALSLTKYDFDHVLLEVPLLAGYFSRVLATRLSRTSHRIVEAASQGVTGKLEMITPSELVQALNTTGRTGALHVRRGDQEIDVIFSEGRIWDVQIQDQETPSPEEAFFEMLAWVSGSFLFEPLEDDEVSERRVYTDTIGLLMEGLRRMDEHRAR